MEYSIKEVAEKFNISAYTLRYYEREGLIPSVQRNDNGRRVYTDVDLGWLELVDIKLDYYDEKVSKEELKRVITEKRNN